MLGIIQKRFMKFDTKELLLEYEFIIFDLDNTLYDESLYLFAGYEEIAQYLSNKYPVCSSSLTNALINQFKSQGRKELFQLVFPKYSIPEDEIQPSLKVLRSFSVEKKIPIYKHMMRFLEELLELGRKIVIVTNGNVNQQKNKIKNIDWKGLKGKVIVYYANEYEPKPSPKILNILMPKEGISTVDKVIYIGDSILDEEFSLNSGMSFCNVRDLKLI